MTKKKMTREELMEMLAKHPGNADEYDVSHIEKKASVLDGKKIIFLGSSVTFGAASFEQSFVEQLAAGCGVIPYKEAVSGTTLVDDVHDGKSYIERMKTIDPEWKADAFICQLSTNDATKKKPLGTLRDGDYDTTTVAGAMEYIIAYARKTWNCPVFFYTGTKYDSAEYAAMVELLEEIQKKHHIEVIDLWHTPPMNEVSEEEYGVYMADPIHPTKAGYLKWWTPEMERQISAFFSSLQ